MMNKGIDGNNPLESDIEMLDRIRVLREEYSKEGEGD